MRKRQYQSKLNPAWIKPDKSAKFSIGDRVMLTVKSTAIASGSIGVVHGVSYKPHETYSGYWYEVNFENFLSNHTIAEAILVEVKSE